MELAPGIRRVGSDSIVNSYLVEEGGEVTIIDAGAPGLWSLVPRELEAMGRRLEDVRAIVLTHGHTDHVGYAERARRERGWPVLVHEADEDLATGRRKNTSGMVRLRIGPLLGFTWWSAPGVASCGCRRWSRWRPSAMARRSTCRGRRT